MPLGAAGPLRHGDAGVGHASSPTPTSATSSPTSSRCRRSSRPSAAKPIAASALSVDELARRASRAAPTVYDKLQCGKCHGTDGRGTGAVATTFEDDWRQPLRAADLTEPWTFHGGATSRDIYMRFRTGMSGTPMPSFKDAASDGEMWDLANYVVSLARKPVWR